MTSKHHPTCAGWLAQPCGQNGCTTRGATAFMLLLLVVTTIGLIGALWLTVSSLPI